MPNDTLSFSSRNLLLLSAGSALFYLFLTLLILRYFHDAPAASLFHHGFGIPAQLGIGIVGGLAGALFIGYVMFHTTMSDILHDYRIIELLGDMRMNGFDRIQISLFAGAGEELLFRGALQPLLGIWITSAIFVAVHGYFKFTSIRHVIFGATMFGLSVGLGILFEWAGLIAAMTAHAVYDVVMLQVGNKCGFGKNSPKTL